MSWNAGEPSVRLSLNDKQKVAVIIKEEEIPAWVRDDEDVSNCRKIIWSPLYETLSWNHQSDQIDIGCYLVLKAFGLTSVFLRGRRFAVEVNVKFALGCQAYR